jgi:hypothetical protein
MRKTPEPETPKPPRAALSPRAIVACAIAALISFAAMGDAGAAPKKKFAYQRQAQSKAACDRFGWPLTREREWFEQQGMPEISSGAKREQIPTRAFVLSLESDSNASYVMPPERKSRSENGYGGAVTFETVPRAGLYQITLSEDGLVDVIQNGHFLKKKASNMRRDCPGIRRSLRVDLAAGALSLQFGGVEQPMITIAVAPAE